MKKLFCMVLALASLGWAQTHIVPNLDSNNTFTGTNAFTRAVSMPNIPFSVLTYGAACNAIETGGVWSGTDDTAAIQAAYTAAAAIPGGMVAFPPGANCYVATATGQFTLPGDNGQVQAGATCSTGLITTSGTTVTLASGTLEQFPTSAPAGGSTISVGTGGAIFTVTAWSATSLTVSATLPTNTTAVPYTLLGGTGGTQGGGVCLNASAEPTNSMPYAINIPAGVNTDGQNATIVGNFQEGVTMPSLSSLSIFQLPANGAFQSVLHDLNFQNVFTPFEAPNGLTIFEVRNVNVLGCGFGSIVQHQDRAKWKNVVMENCAAGLIEGGWWTQRTNINNEGGGFSDKSKYENISFIQNQGMYYNAWAQAFDSFFDAYIWKPQHNTDGRLTDPLNASYDIRGAVDKGVYGVGIAHYARGVRPSNGNVVDLMMHYGSPRYAFMGESELQLSLRSIDVEQFGWGDGANGNCPFGITTSCTSTVLGQTFPSGFTNPYVAGKTDGLVFVQGGGAVEHLGNDNPGATAASIDIGGNSALTTFDINGGSTDSTYNQNWLSSNNTAATSANGTAMFGLARGGLQNQYGLKYYDNAAGGDANTRTCIETAGADTMCFPKQGNIAVNNNFQFLTGTMQGYSEASGFANLIPCLSPQGTSGTLGLCRAYFGRGGIDLGFGTSYFDDVANDDANTHTSLTYGTFPLNSTPSELFSVWMGGYWSLGKLGTKPASGYAGEVGGSILFDTAPTTSGMTTGCVQLPCTVYSAHVLNAVSSGSRSATSTGYTPPSGGGYYHLSIAAVMNVTAGSGSGNVQPQVYCTAPDSGATNGVSATATLSSTAAAGTAANGNTDAECSSTQPIEWGVVSANGNATIDAWVTVVRMQ